MQKGCTRSYLEEIRELKRETDHGAIVKGREQVDE